MNTFLRPFALVALGATSLVLSRAAEAPALPANIGEIPCKIHETVSPVFPLRLLLDGVLHGKVQLVLEVDNQGTLGDALVTAYTHRGFAEEALRAVKRWRFEPGLSDGKPVISILNVTFNFETSGVTVVQKLGVTLPDQKNTGWDYEYWAHGPSTLDRPPVPRQLPGPAYLKEWIEQGRTGVVVVEFFIDETGQARLPVILSQADDHLAAAAIDAVKRWRFEPPTSAGQPVLAHAQQVFVFKPEPAAETRS